MRGGIWLTDASYLIDAFKRTSIEAVNAGKPVEVRFGKVIDTSPLKISLEQKLVLNEGQLVLCRNVCDYEILAGSETVSVHNGLRVGEQVVLLRQQGGQKYIVWDRIA